MPEPLVSVIVPTYNRPRMLERALQSIAKQTFRDYEILVVNDGGEDMSKIVSEFRQAVYISHARNRGLPAARNTAIEHARGDYIAYLDDDDIWYPLHLGICLTFLMEEARRFVYTDCYYRYDESRLIRMLSLDYDRSILLARNLTPCICVVHEKALLYEAGRFDETLPNHEDYDLWLRMSEITPFYHIPVVTGAYSKRSDASQMSGDARKMLDGLQFVQKRYQERVRV